VDKLQYPRAGGASMALAAKRVWSNAMGLPSTNRKSWRCLRTGIERLVQAFKELEERP